jgi:hypothetical protein
VDRDRSRRRQELVGVLERRAGLEQGRQQDDVELAVELPVVTSGGGLRLLGERGQSVGELLAGLEQRRRLAPDVARGLPAEVDVEGAGELPDDVPVLLDEALGGDRPVERLPASLPGREAADALLRSQAGRTTSAIRTESFSWQSCAMSVGTRSRARRASAGSSKSRSGSTPTRWRTSSAPSAAAWSIARVSMPASPGTRFQASATGPASASVLPPGRSPGAGRRRPRRGRRCGAAPRRSPPRGPLRGLRRRAARRVRGEALAGQHDDAGAVGAERLVDVGEPFGPAGGQPPGSAPRHRPPWGSSATRARRASRARARPRRSSAGCAATPSAAGGRGSAPPPPGRARRRRRPWRPRRPRRSPPACRRPR